MNECQCECGGAGHKVAEHTESGWRLLWVCSQCETGIEDIYDSSLNSASESELENKGFTIINPE